MQATNSEKEMTMKEPTIHDVNITGGFWAQKDKINTETAIFYQWQQLEATRCIDNFRIAAGLKTGFREGFFFADSDAYKWLDAASRLLAHHPDPKLMNLVDEFICILERAQESDGYLYTYNQIHFAGQRWVNLQIEHEFYCLGHLIEAGISHFESTGEDRLLNIAKKAADLLVNDFSESIPDFTDGHEEIEIALIKLWRVTDSIQYLALAKAFIERRGTIKGFPLKMIQQVICSGKRLKQVNQNRAVWRKDHPEDIRFTLPEHNKHKVPFLAEARFAVSALTGKYNQQHLPVMEQTRAEGHAVRFTYLKTAEAMLARVTGEENRINPLRQIWEQMVSKRMYVTGGIGSLPISEGFGRDYELDPEVAYAETCAALGCMLWNHEMSCLTGEARFEDLYEWQLYNAASVGIGRDGCSYFYNNPLVSHGETSRAGWYDIPCCPSNLSRIWASLSRNICSYDNSEIRINQFISSETVIDTGQKITLKMKSELPWGNQVTLKLTMDKPQSTNLWIRLPAWAYTCVMFLNGQPVLGQISNAMPKLNAANGLKFNEAKWIKFSRQFQPGDEIKLFFEMSVRLVKQDKRIHGCGGKFAVTQGPVVYCLESIDNPEDIFKARVVPGSLQVEYDARVLDGTWMIKGVSASGKPLTFIPYMLWGNRGAGQMTVFVN